MIRANIAVPLSVVVDGGGLSMVFLSRLTAIGYATGLASDESRRRPLGSGRRLGA
jgi:hypothetical protein